MRWELTWSPDGTRMAVANQDTQVSRWSRSRANRVARKCPLRHAVVAGSGLASRDQKVAVLGSDDQIIIVWIVSLDTKQAERLL